MPKQETLQELCKSLRKQMKQSPARRRLIEAVDAVNRYTASLRKKDRFKRVPYVTAEQQRRLAELHKAVGAAADAILDGPESPGVKSLVRRFSGLASRNFALLQGYDPVKAPKTLDTIEEEVRALRLDLRGGGAVQKYHAGGAERQVVSFLNEKGEKITGFFTPKSQLNPLEQISRAFTNLAEGGKNITKGGAAYVRSFLERLIPQEADEPERMAALRQLIEACTTSLDEKLVVSPGMLAEQMGATLGVTARVIENQVGIANLQELADALEAQRSMVEARLGSAAIPDGARLDTRAAAVSAVADLLGCSRVVARARPMVLVDRNGQEIEGTFTASTGAHPDNLPENQDVANANYSVMSALYGNTYRDISDLQVVDFICGFPNRNRHRMSYDFNQDSSLMGIQGIHNEDAFGLMVPKPGQQNGMLTLPENMRVLSKATCERVLALQPATLKYALRGFGLSDEELDAAGKRLTLLQQSLQKSLQFYEEHADEYQAEGNGPRIEGLGDQPGPKLPQLLIAEPEQAKAKPQRRDDRIKPNAEKDDPYHLQNDSFSFSLEQSNPLDNEELPEGELKLADGQIRVLEDHEFRQLPRKAVTLMVDKNTGQRGEELKDLVSGNTFAEVFDQVTNMRSYYDEQKYRDPAQGKNVIGMNNRCIPAILNADAVEANRISFHLSKEENDKLFHSSGSYRSLKRAMDAYAAYSRKLSQRISAANSPELRALPDYRMDLEAVVRPAELKKLQKLGASVEKAAEKYLIGKGILPDAPGRQPKRSPESYSFYTQSRISLAQDALKLGRRDARILPEEQDAAEVNERRAKENLARRLGDRAEQRYNRKHGIVQPIGPEDPDHKLITL